VRTLPVPVPRDHACGVGPAAGRRRHGLTRRVVSRNLR
jgi:hypothetical protein